MSESVIIGVSGHGEVISDIILSNSNKVVGFHNDVVENQANIWIFCFRQYK